ncbi:MAG: hypothetical protein JOY80_11855 [Candidatus Dormibacteraeota bacterium]|nr:hypothetical protein [Candidatus Dormibacteraeota bacterium]
MVDTSQPAHTLEVHYKLFGTDGVSLQSQELSRALRGRGWTVYGCASDIPAGAPGLRLEELSYQSADAVALRSHVFPDRGTAASESTGVALTMEIGERAAPIRRSIESFIDAHGIQVVHVRNLMSLPYNLPATVALHGIMSARPDIGFLLQHHDLYWEGPNASTFVTPYRDVADLMQRVMVPVLPNARHVLINPIAADALFARTGIDGTVIPDGFDFQRTTVAIDETAFRRELRILAGAEHPISDDDLAVAMPARVAINKAIELAIEFTAGLETRRPALEQAPAGVGRRRRAVTPRSRIVLLLPQGEDVADNRDYLDRLVAYARHLGITLAYGGSIVVPDKRYEPGSQRYPFYSTYQAEDIVCYPPEHEGFGNQAIETVWARLPLVVVEYPVFRRFVRDHVPHYITLGQPEELERMDEYGGLHRLRSDVLERALDETVRVLTDHQLEQRWTEENYTALERFCGIEHVAAQYERLYVELGATAPPNRPRTTPSMR